VLGTAAVVVAAVAAAAVCTLAQTWGARTSTAEARAADAGANGAGAAGAGAAGAGVAGAAAAGMQAHQPSTAGEQVLRVVAMTPSVGARRVDGTGSIEVGFSAPLAADSPTPALSPRVSGQWHQIGATMVFTPDIGFAPSTRVTVRVPAGPTGVRSAAGALLARPLVAHFSTKPYSLMRLSEILSQLGYLPLSWAPDASWHLVGQAGRPGARLAAQIAMAYSPPAGKFHWDKGYPPVLRSQWRPGGPNLLVTGAVMAFESQHGMQSDGLASRAVWAALFAAADRGRDNRAGYTYALATKAAPETLTIWHDGKIVLQSLANTGIPVAPTADGTFPVYLRYRFQIMTGVNPDGSRYADPVSFVAYFNGGDAVHYFPRGSYGFEQSLGCLELPLSSAARAWPYLTYGSLVTVVG